MKYDISDIIKLCNANPMNSVWQIIELSTGKVFPVTGFSGTCGSISFSCNYEQKEDSKQQTSKAVVNVRDLVYHDKVFTLYIDNRNGIR